ncbi:MAG TPA: hypothetical protein VF183_15255 [Acidimicrobiales bacterium]
MRSGHHASIRRHRRPAYQAALFVVLFAAWNDVVSREDFDRLSVVEWGVLAVVVVGFVLVATFGRTR